jgi:hypothetical protein
MNGPDSFSERWQQALPTAGVVALAIWVTYVSFNVDDPEPYLFPRLIAVAMLGLSTFALLRALSGRGHIGKGLYSHTMRNIWPGLVVMVVYVALAAEWLGFYTAGAAAFLAIYSLYDPAPHSDPRVWVRRLLITIGFMSVLYCIFALILRVQTPRGLLV